MTIVAVSYSRAVAITPGDTSANNFVNAAETLPICDAIYVGGAGTVTVVLPDTSTVAFTCVAGQILPIRGIRVNNSGTSATLLVALYAN